MDELTDAERARVEAAIRAGVHFAVTVSGWQAEDRDRMKEPLQALLALWEATPPEVRETVTGDLAARASVENVVSLDLGDALRDRLALLRGRRGPETPGLAEAVEALFEVWVERGNRRTIGNLHLARVEGRTGYPACDFIAPHLLGLFPDAFPAHDEGQRLEAARTKADTQLRALRRAPD